MNKSQKNPLGRKHKNSDGNRNPSGPNSQFLFLWSLARIPFVESLDCPHCTRTTARSPVTTVQDSANQTRNRESAVSWTTADAIIPKLINPANNVVKSDQIKSERRNMHQKRSS